MSKFRYAAKDDRGNSVGGETEAASAADVERSLREQGLDAITVIPAPPPETAAESLLQLPSAQAEGVLATMAELSTAQLPLAAGLRAAADESVSVRVAHALRTVAQDVEQGFSLEAIMSRRGKSLPGYLRGLVLAAARTGRLGPALDELVDHQRTMRDIRWSVFGAVAYPLTVLAMTIPLLFLMPVLVIPQFKKMFEEFGLKLPIMTKQVIRISDFCVWLASHREVWVVVVVAAILAFAFLWIPGLPGAPARQRVLASLPLVGRLWDWGGAAAFARLLAILVDSGVPLPDALRLTGGGVRDANVRDLCGVLSEAVSQGRSLADSLAATPCLPASLVPLVRWGEKTGELADAMRIASDMFVGRIRLRAVLLRSVSPPLVFLFVFLAIGIMMVNMFMAFFSVFKGLS
jgi:general secretion pathway protein F